MGCPHRSSVTGRKFFPFTSSGLISNSIPFPLWPEFFSFCFFQVITRTTRFDTSAPIVCYSKPMAHRAMSTNTLHMEYQTCLYAVSVFTFTSNLLVLLQCWVFILPMIALKSISFKFPGPGWTQCVF